VGVLARVQLLLQLLPQPPRVPALLPPARQPTCATACLQVLARVQVQLARGQPLQAQPPSRVPRPWATPLLPVLPLCARLLLHVGHPA